MSAVAVTVDDDCGADPAWVATMCKAVDRQAHEAAIVWGVDYTPVVYFSSDVLAKLEGDELSKFTAEFRLLTISTSIDAPGALGYHTDVAGVIFARVLWQGPDTSVTVSHEVLEEMVNPTVMSWAQMADGRSQALEVCDRVEGDTYNTEADEILVRLSNYLLPSAFVPGSARPWDRLGTLPTDDGMTAGGYTIVKAADGDVTDVYARTDAGAVNAGAKRRNPTSRVARLLGAPAAAAGKGKKKAA